ncbi:myrosinase 1-like [Schistocerca piceifrons]|uniref:myrosinase 1-like n=1 Tax=Schistocerca piceifrons TaxID=274613 RepID=UPI001F5E4ACB|nr:myrosinase 1-like [Schistocerca piceifrons]
MLLLSLVLGALALTARGQNATFPDDFLFAVSSAAYEIEGGWDADGKGVSIWDTLTHDNSQYINDGSNGDVASDSYHKYEEDVQLVRDLGVDIYRFSISWARVLPVGDVSQINQAGVDYYNNLIDLLIANGIQPMVTMYHYDLPQPLQLLGGWTNPVVAQYFREYARFLFQTFGDRVKWWVTFNEPTTIAFGYSSTDTNAPAIGAHGFGDYTAAHCILRSHAMAYRLYDQQFRAAQGVCVSQIVLSSSAPIFTYYPCKFSCAVIISMMYHLGWFAHPIYTEEGGYPLVMEERIWEDCINDNIWISRLPEFSAQELVDLRGAADFFALNHFTTQLASNGQQAYFHPSHDWDTGAILSFDDSWAATADDNIKVVPWGLRSLLNWINNEYDVRGGIFVTGNGFPDAGELEDSGRQEYYRAYLAEILNAIHEDGINLIGYTGWSLLDGFEWIRGYTVKYGFYQVDFSDQNRTRTPKPSATMFQEIVATRQLPNRAAKPAFT